MKLLSHYAVAFVLASICGLLQTQQAEAGQAVWIDTDPACGNAITDDVDDCWALLMALRSTKLDVLGISTSFGNVGGDEAYDVAVKLIQRYNMSTKKPPLFRGADAALSLRNPAGTEATAAMARALTKEPLTLVALGPLTNIATLIILHPEKMSNVKQVIAIAGQRPKPHPVFFPGDSRLFHLHDLNLQKDSAAFSVILESSIPITLVPYEVASKVSVTSEDLDHLTSGSPESRWLADISRPWLRFWNSSLKSDGFFPFDSLAIGMLTMPSLFTCDRIPVKLERKRSLFVSSRDSLLVSHGYRGDRTVTYCSDVEQKFKSLLLETLS